MASKKANQDEVVTAELPVVTATTAPILSVEIWAERKGMLPEVFAAPTYRMGAGGVPTELGTIAVQMQGIQGPRPNPEFWKFAAARALRQWPQGAEVSEAEFEEAVRVATVEHIYR